jgi:hypothetical protein
MTQFQYPRPLPPERVKRAKIAPNIANTLAVLSPNSSVAEVGVRFGDVTEILLNCPVVTKVLAMDHFDLHSRPREGNAGRLGGKSHLDFMESRFSEAIKTRKLETRRGRLDAIKALPGSSTNAFFIRGCRDFGPLMAELYMCDSKLRPRGLIWVSDYIMADYTSGQQYDVVRAVNEFVGKSSYDLAYLILDHTMFCTVVLQRPA